MMTPPSPATISTGRLRLRPLTTADRVAFATLHADPDVMEFLGGTLDRAASDALIDRLIGHREQHGFAPWCVERGGEVLGWCGLLLPAFHPSPEIGWRLRRNAWGHGYATEAAIAVLDDWRTRPAGTAADRGTDEVISFAAVDNLRSRAVMERIGLVRDRHADFDHPALAPDDRLRHHVLYRARRDEWMPPPATERRNRNRLLSDE